jgi:hypothetical protein
MSKFIDTGTKITAHSSPIEPLQSPLSREKPQKAIKGWQKLLINAEEVNRLSEQLEKAVFELKITASEIKGDCYTPLTFKYKALAIPCIHYKKPGLIVLATRKIDLFQQEREALQLSQMLRRRTKRRLKRPIPAVLLKSSKFKAQNKNFIQQLVLIARKLTKLIGRKPPINRSSRVNSISC